MKWEQVREKYPNTWVLFEAIEAHSDSGKRIVDEMAVLDIFATGQDAMKRYIELHKYSPERELFIYSTANENLEIRERIWMSITRMRIKYWSSRITNSMSF